MFAGFNLDLCNTDKKINFKEFEDIGKTHLSHQKAKYEEKIKKYVINGTADGTKVQDDWFPNVDADIFISHSHRDLGLARGLAGWLNKTFGIKCFIDYDVWGYIDELLEEINSEYSNKRKSDGNGYLYSHEKCNTASKHVNMMLSIALQKMIDKTEATFVLNTENCIAKYEDVYDTATYSPWIYQEIVCTEIIRKKPLISYRRLMVKFAKESKQYDTAEEYTAAYKVSLNHLKKINIDKLIDWSKRYDETYNAPLDALYIITHPDEMKELVDCYKNMPMIING